MIRECMNPQVYIISPEEPISRARNLMLKHGIGRLIVIEDDKPIGIITKKDIVYGLSQAEPQWRRRPIDNIPARIIMTENPLTIHPEATSAQAAEIMLENQISGLPVIKEEQNETKLIGIVTKQDLIKQYSEQEYTTRVENIMDTYIITVNRHHTIDHVLYEMESNKTNTLIVTDDGMKPLGIITTDQIVFTDLVDSSGSLLEKEIKMARKDTTGGMKKYRYIREVPLIAEDIMNRLSETVTSDERAVDAAKIMINNGIKTIPVVDNGIVGLLTADNILKEIQKQTTQ